MLRNVSTKFTKNFMKLFKGFGYWLVLIYFLTAQNVLGVTYETLGSGLWETASLWNPSQPPEIIGPNDSVIVNHTMLITSSLAMTVVGYLEVNGEMRDINGSTSNLLVRGHAVIQPNATLGIQSLSVRNGGVFDNSGFVILLDGIVNAGTINNTGDMVILTTANGLQNQGDFNNCGYFLAHGNASFTNGNVTNCATGFFAILRNLAVGSNADWTNNGLVDIGGNLFLDGDGFGAGQLYVCGNLELDPTALWNPAETVCVDGNINDPNGFTVTLCPYPSGDVCPLTLPIELLSFECRDGELGIALHWATAMEINNDYFSIERSSDGETFGSIGFVPGTNQSNGIASYDFVDQGAESGQLYYYRLKQLDRDGSVFYSKVLEVWRSETDNNAMLIFPNPVNEGRITLQVANGKRASLMSLEGKELVEWMLLQEEGEISHLLDLPSSIPSGMYLLSVENKAGQRQFHKILVA